jgi:tetratricopeptide (TPR) repeat protein
MGETTPLPPAALGSAVPRLQVLLHLGHYAKAWHCTGLDGLYGEIGWGGDQARCRLLLAELARRTGDMTAARKYLDEASSWVLHSGSAEHLGLIHLVRARLARAAGEGETAQRAADEGLHVARQCGLGLLLIELLCEQAEIALARPDPVAAEAFAAAALERGAADECRFAWGEAEALHLWGRAVFAMERTDQARATLAKALDLSQRIGDPRAAEVEQLLARAGG